MADVFISYAREDRAHAEKLATEVQALGLTVWWDRELLPAEKWDAVIEQELDGAAAVLVIWTPNSITNENVREEAHEARNQDKVAPVLIGDCRPPLFFRRHQFEDFTQWSGQPEALAFQRLAIQLTAYARGQEAADALPLDGETPPRLAATAVRVVEQRTALQRWAGLGAALLVVAGVVAYVRGFDMLGVLGPYNATVLVLAGAAIGLFRAAELALPAGPKALVARWLAGEKSFSSSQAFLTMFESVFGKKHWTLSCFWRSMVATLFVYVVLLALFVDFGRLFEQASAPGAFRPSIGGSDWALKNKLERSALLLLVIVPITNIFADFVSLWQTRMVLRWSANGWLPLSLGVVLDAALTAAVFVVLLPVGPMLAIYADGGFTPGAWTSAVGFVPEVWRGFWMIFEGNPIGEIDSMLAAEASLSTTTLLIAFVTTFITSVWLWLALLAAPLFWLMNIGRRKGAGWIGRASGAVRRPIQALGYGAAAAVLAVGFGGRAAVDLLPAPQPAPFQDCPDCPWMVAVPGGAFMMGSPDTEAERASDEGPQREVTIQPFAMGVFEVTFREWMACVRDGFCQSNPKPDDANFGRGKRPVFFVSWEDVTQKDGFVDWLNSKVPGAPYRLPSEAEWEYAARAGTKTRYYVGDELSHKDANFDNGAANFDGADRGQTLPVGAFRPNAYGLHDMHGNVREMVQDCYYPRYVGAPTDGSVWNKNDEPCGAVSVRDSSWFNVGHARARSADRDSMDTSTRSDWAGFRVARALPE